MKIELVPQFFIRSTRSKLGLSQVQLANILGTTRSVVANWESGRTIPRAHIIIVLKMLVNKSKRFREKNIKYG
jgi:DNA-binding transcriptional regulator YiaG